MHKLSVPVKIGKSLNCFIREFISFTRGLLSNCLPFQGFTQKGCISCKASVTAVHTSHWEGGKGCRNKIKMNRCVYRPG